MKLKYTCNYSCKHYHNIAREMESLGGEEGGRRARKRGRREGGKPYDASHLIL